MLRKQQLEEVLNAISEDTCVKLLDISGGHNISFIKPDILARAVQQLEKIISNLTTLSAEQSTGVMEAICGSQRVEMSDLNLCRLSSVDPELLVKAVCLGGSNLNHTGRISDLLGPEGPKCVFIELIWSDKVNLRL